MDSTWARIDTLWASAVVLATGGASGLYRHATNPSTGDGIAMAWRAGCRVANMEFVQFHPTCLDHPGAQALLISEAVRGEGGRLLLPDGTRFMYQYDDRGELAPRDIVSRAIHHEMAQRGLEHVYLDISHEPAAVIRERFPNILRVCAACGFDLTREPIPVVPAAHYTCGGIVTDGHGQTDVQQLYAVGECSFTGLHGANRLASNSLLEALAFAKTVSVQIARQVGCSESRPPLATRLVEQSCADNEAGPEVLAYVQKLKTIMWDRVGIVRTREGLARAARELEELERAIDAMRHDRGLGRDVLELRNLVTVAQLITKSARQRQESRGLHYNVDFPALHRDARDTALRPR